MPSIYDPMFLMPARAPFRWGTSPFLSRGLLYSEEIALAHKALDGKTNEILRRSGDPGLEAFLSQRFSTLEWYDALPLVFFGMAISRARGLTLNQYIRDVSETHAARALSGFSGIVLKLVSTEAVATWLPRVSAWYNNFGSAETKVVGERHVRGSRSGVPQCMVQGWSVSATHFIETVLAHAGAHDPRAHTLEVEREGEREGHPIYRIAFDITWSA
jgi:hypothetical protein